MTWVARTGAPSSLPMVTVMSGTTALLAAGAVTLRSGTLLDGRALQPLGALICCGVFLVATWVAHVVFRRFGFHRRPLTVPSVAASVVVIAVVWGVDAGSAQVWKHPWTRYSDEFGGPGACLADTSYGDRWHVLVRGWGREARWRSGPAPSRARRRPPRGRLFVCAPRGGGRWAPRMGRPPGFSATTAADERPGVVPVAHVELSRRFSGQGAYSGSSFWLRASPRAFAGRQ